MSALCSNLHPFIDGELDDAGAAAFRLHLGDCTTCPAEFETAVMADSLAEDLLIGRAPRTVEIAGLGAAAATPAAVAPAVAAAPAASTAAPARKAKRRSGWAWAAPAGVGLAAAAALFLWLRADSGHGGALAMLVADDHRTLEARLAYPGMDRHRPLRRERGGGSHPWVEGRQQALATLEERQDEHGLAVASLLEGRHGEADSHLSRSPQSAAVFSDAAAVALARGDSVTAQGLARKALAIEPRHPQALWNLALSLELGGARTEAAKAFEAVAALGEPGWSEEARQRAAALTPGPR